MKALILLLPGLSLFAQSEIPTITVQADPRPTPVCAIPLIRVPSDPRWDSKMPVVAPKSEHRDPIGKPPAIPTCTESAPKANTPETEPRP